MPIHSFGGTWTERKLSVVRQYLEIYAHALLLEFDAVMKRIGAGGARAHAAADQASLVARLSRTLAREALDIERRLAAPGAATPEAGRNERMLGQVVQSVRVLSALAPAAGAGSTDKTDDDPVPEDIDEFRYEVARRIRGFIEAHQAQQAEVEQKQDETPE
jgi:hypothetical protein